MSQPPILRILFVPLFLGSCHGIADDPDRRTPTVQLAPTDHPATKVALPAGTQLTLRTVAVHNKVATTPVGSVLDGWWRVALRQSRHLDVAAGVETCASEHEIEFHLDGKAACFTSSLRTADGKSIPLAAACDSSLTRGIDRLAWLTRVALGERFDMKPVPCGAAYSSDPECVRLTELGLSERVTGDLKRAARTFQRARSHDGGCALTLLHLASTAAAFGGDAAARSSWEIANEALRLRLRLTPHSEHRLARTILLSRRDDRGLLELGESYRKDRPHDPHASYSVGLARVRLGDHPAAYAVLWPLRDRWPALTTIRYQLAFALLGTSRAKAALAILESIEKKLPRGFTARPMAMALYHAGEHDRLKKYLSALRLRSGVRGSPAELEILRMQASHAILTDDRAAATKHLVDGLLFVRRRRSQITDHTISVAEDGEVLARLGAHDELRQALDAFDALGQLPATFANALTYLRGLLEVQSNRDAGRALATLRKSHASTWQWQLQAAIHHRRGELDAETRALDEAVGRSRSALLHANVVRALNASGQRAAADKVATHLRQRLLAFDQRKPFDHPLMTPGRAMAFRATTPQ